MANRKTRRTRRATSRRTNTRTTRRATTPRPRTRRAGKVQRPWSREEIAFMRKFYRTHETSWIARQLRRSVYSVRYKAVDLNIKKSRPSVWRGNRGSANAFRKVAKTRTRNTRRTRTSGRRSTRSRSRSYRASSRTRRTRKAAPRRTTRRNVRRRTR